MDTCLTNWNTEVDVELPLPSQRKPLGLDNDVMEILWQNGEVILQSQTCRKPSFDPTWINCHIDELFEKDFYADFLSEIPSSDLIGNSDAEKVFPFSGPEVCASTSFPQPRYEPSESFVQNQYMEGNKTANLQFPFASQVVAEEVDMSWDSSSGTGGKMQSAELEENYGMEVKAQNSSMERETTGRPANTSSGGSGGSSCQKTSCQSNDSNRNKRKHRDVGESECPSDATGLESASGNNKSSRKSGTTRRSRVAEVHNRSERKRRDRINERMRALQELIPHCHKSDKASMLDEAIEYMKSLQLQLQLLWMGRGMSPMMHPGMQQYIYYAGMGIRPPTLPVIQNISKMPVVDHGPTAASTPNQAHAGHDLVLMPVNYQTQMQNASFPDQQCTQNTGFHFVPNAPHMMNTFNYSPHSTERNQVVAPTGHGSS